MCIERVNQRVDWSTQSVGPHIQVGCAVRAESKDLSAAHSDALIPLEAQLEAFVVHLDVLGHLPGLLRDCVKYADVSDVLVFPLSSSRVENLVVAA